MSHAGEKKGPVLASIRTVNLRKAYAPATGELARIRLGEMNWRFLAIRCTKE
jgi:hypothetical protein